MASPLKKKQRTSSVIITQNMDCPVLFYGSCWTISSYQGGCQRERITRFGGLETEEKGFRSSLNSANRKKRQMVHAVISLYEL